MITNLVGESCNRKPKNGGIGKIASQASGKEIAMTKKENQKEKS